MSVPTRPWNVIRGSPAASARSSFERGAAAGDPQLDLRADQPHRADQQVDALRVVEPRGREQPAPALVRAEPGEPGRRVRDEHVGAGREVAVTPGHRGRDRAEAGDRVGGEGDAVEELHELADERAGEREQVLAHAGRAAQRRHAREELGQRIARSHVLLHERAQLDHRRRRIRIVRREMHHVIGVVEAPQAVQHVDDVVRMADHPGGVLGRHHEVEAGQVELGEPPVGVDEIPELELRARQLDQLSLMGRVLVEMILQPPPQVLRSTDHVRDRAGRDDGDVHAARHLRGPLLA